MNILYIAYSCDPFNGSEDKIGWNVPFANEKLGNNVYIITKEEQRKNIEEYCKKNNYSKMKIYYVDIPEFYKSVFKGAFYSGRLGIWNKKAYKIAIDICEKEKIDIIHQITPIEFRAIGDYGKISNTKFVLGPLGGGERIPVELKKYCKKYNCLEGVRYLLNKFYRWSNLKKNKYKFCDYIMFANKETYDFISETSKELPQNEIYLEFGIEDEEIEELKSVQHNNKNKEKNAFNILVAGRLNYRKGHLLLFDALKQISDKLDYEVSIVGDGPNRKKIKKYLRANKEIEKHVKIKGNIEYEKMKYEYDKADILVMPSLRETSGNVMLEAIRNGVPVIAMKKFGAANFLNSDIGWLYDGKTQKEITKDLSKKISEAMMNSKRLELKGTKCREYAKKYEWSTRVQHYNRIYNSILNKK